MKVKEHILALLVCMFFLASCTSPMRKSLINEEMPQFVGSITPITIPIQPEYQLLNHNGKQNESLAMDINVTLNTGSGKSNHSVYETEVSTNVLWNVKKLGDMLTWNIKGIERTENNNSFKPHIPIADVTLLTDKYGDIKESEISLPYFEQDQVRSKIGETKFEEIKKEMKDAVKFSSTLPKTPVITGDKYIKAGIAFKDFLESLPFGAIVTEEPTSIVKGWGYFGGSKVLVTTIDFVFEKIVEGNTTLRIIMKGYGLTHSENFMPVHSDVFFKLGFFDVPRVLVETLWKKFEIKGELPTDPMTSGDFFIRIRNITSSKLEN